MKYTAKKLFKGYVSVRDYIVNKCLSKGEDLLIEFSGKFMTISLNDLKNNYQIHKTKFQSKFGNKQYELIDFEFIPDIKKQISLF